MGKQSGLGDQFYVDGFRLSGDINSLSKISGGPAALDFTGIDKLAYERQGGKRDGGIDFNAFFNAAAGQAHPVLSGLPTGDRIASYFHGAVLGGDGAAMVCKQINYDPTRGNDGSLMLAVSTQANSFGLEWCTQITAGDRTDTTATNGTGVDQTTVSTALGWQAYLQVTGITGTSVTVTIKDSADNTTFTALTGGAFTAATTNGAQRLQSAAGATVRRYVRVDTTGTFSSATFNVLFVRNLTAVSF